MATYNEWNRAIIDFIIQSLPLGSHVFLSVDEDTLATIGHQLNLAQSEKTYIEDFQNAVCSRVIHKGSVHLPSIVNPMRDHEGYPRYIAFLCVMVLAAYRMGDDEDKDVQHNDYFAHLNFILNIDAERAGIETGKEESMWQDWAKWLRSRGYLPTAYGGEASYRYTGYPISQTLLRQSDKDRLWRRFSEHNWSQRLDEDTVIAQIKSDGQYLTAHLRQLLDRNNPHSSQIYTQLTRACFDVYESWVESGGVASVNKRASTYATKRAIKCGILRQHDTFIGSTAYYLFPRQHSGADLQYGYVVYQGKTFDLQVEYPGWFQPLWEVTAQQLAQGIELPLHTAHTTLEKLILSPREFWILTSDPNVPESDNYASWFKGPTLGELFIMLCREHLHEDMQQIRQEGLIQWEGDPKRIWPEEDWLEYRNVTIVAEPHAWDDVYLHSENLLQSLKPQSTFAISLRGGVRVPRQQAWLVGHGPEVSVIAFYPEVDISVTRTDTDEMIFQQEGTIAGEIIQINWSSAANYVIRVQQGNLFEERAVSIVDWDALQLAPLPQELPTEIQRSGVFGPLVLGEV